MKINFKNISNFNNYSDLLPILNGAIITDIIVILLSIFGYIDSKTLKTWYINYHINAVIADVLIIVIGIIITRFLYSRIFGNTFSLVYFILLAVVVQIIHDILFYLFFTTVPENRNKMLDTFKEYAKENGYKAMIADSLMVISTSILASIFASQTTNFNLILVIISVYFIPYLIYT